MSHIIVKKINILLVTLHLAWIKGQSQIPGGGGGSQNVPLAILFALLNPSTVLVLLHQLVQFMLGHSTKPFVVIRKESNVITTASALTCWPFPKDFPSTETEQKRLGFCKQNVLLPPLRAKLTPRTALSPAGGRATPVRSFFAVALVPSFGTRIPYWSSWTAHWATLEMMAGIQWLPPPCPEMLSI